jgi:hypothetical protein
MQLTHLNNSLSVHLTKALNSIPTVKLEFMPIFQQLVKLEF